MSRKDSKSCLHINDLPNELLSLIFTNISAHELCKSIIITCRKWRTILDSNSFWTQKLIHDRKASHKFINYLQESGVYEPKKVYFNNLYEKNMIKNPCGDEGFYAWCLEKCVVFSKQEDEYDYFDDDEEEDENQNEDVTSTRNLYTIYNQNFEKFKFVSDEESENRGFLIEFASTGAVQAVDEKSKPIKNFATNYDMCTKYQVIDLNGEGYVQDLIKLGPKIYVEDWYCARHDCGSLYCLEVALYDSNFEKLDSVSFFDKIEQRGDSKWRKFSHIFEYHPNIRYILFQHGGKDTQFWAGHYGIKITNSQVRFKFY